MIRSLGRRSVVGAVAVALGSLYVIGASVASVAGAPTPVSTHASVQRAKSGAVRVTLTGTWAWKHAPCTAAQAVGFAVAWNDKADPGLLVAGQRVGSPQDAVVHANSAAPCGTASSGYLTGSFGPLSHTYASAASVPAKICPVAYDLGANRNALVNAVRSNSLRQPTGTPTVACVSVTVAPPARASAHVASHRAPTHVAARSAVVNGCHGGGPQIECNGSMEGNLGVNPGNDLFGGFHFEISDSSAPTTVTFQGARIVYNYICRTSGATGSFDLPISPNSYVVPAGTTGDYPPGGQSDPAVNQGTMKAPDVCNGGQYQVNAQSGGATFEALLIIDRPGVHLSHFQFHYGDHQGTSWSADAQWFPAPVAPTYTCAAPTAVTATTATLAGTTTDTTVTAAQFVLAPAQGSVVSTQPHPGSFTGAATGLTPDTTYTYTVNFLNGATLKGTGSNAGVCTFHTPNLITPNYSCSAPTNVGQDSATLHGSTTDATVTAAQFLLAPAHGSVASTQPQPGTFTGAASGLTPDTTYTYTVNFLNGATLKGIGSNAGVCTFHTQAAPTYTCTGASNIGTNGAALAGATTDVTVDAATFTLNPTGTLSTPAQGPTGTFTTHATNLAADTHYSYTVKFFHGANHVGPIGGATCSFDTSPATYTCTAAQPLSPTSALIGGVTNDNAVNGASALLSQTGGASSSVLLSGSNGNFSATATGLQPDTHYSYTVSFTGNGVEIHRSTNGGCSFTTPGVVTPTYRCDAPTFLSPTEAILVGETTDVTVHAATFSVNAGAPVAGTPSTTNTGVFTYDQTNLQPGTNYSYTVTFAATPAQSATCAFTTPSVSYVCLPTTHIMPTSATLNASTTDNRVTGVDFTLTPGSQQITGNETSNGFFSGNATGLTASTSYSYVANFVGNGATLGSATCQFQTPGTPPPAITIAVNKVNDANGDGSFTKDEVAPAPHSNVPFQVTVRNTSAVPVILTAITDQWPGQTPFSVTCEQAFIGTILSPAGQPGDSATCSFTLNGYAPNVGAIINTAIVHGCQVDANGHPVTTNCEVLPSTSRVTVTQVLPFKVVRPPTTLPFTGLPFGLGKTVFLSSLLIGCGLLMLTWPQLSRTARRIGRARA